MKRVVVIASGETERRAIPHLVSHLQDSDIRVDMRIPPNNRQLTARTVAQIIRASLYEVPPPDKIVILLDLDGRAPCLIMDPLKEELEHLICRMVISVIYAYAQQHLEAWYFADANGLRNFLGGRALGSVDTSQPDAIGNPKLHLKHLLNGVYTARVSEKIAMRLDSQTIAQRSTSFRRFLEAVQDGESPSSRG